MKKGPPPRDPFEAFLYDIEPFLDDWQAIDIRVIAIRHEKGWQFDSVRATLVPDAEVPIVMGLPSTEFVRAIHEVWQSKNLQRLLAMCQSGELRIDSLTVDAREKRGPDTYTPPSYHVRSFRRDESATEFGIDYMTWRLQGFASTGNLGDWYHYREIINAALRSGDPPWDGLADLRKSFVGQNQDTAMRTEQRLIELLAPVYTRIAIVNLQEHSATVTVELDRQIDPGEVSLAVFLDSETGTTRDLQSLPDKRPAENLRYKFEFELPTPFSRLSCSLNYKGREVDRFEKKVFLPMGGHPHWLAFQEIVGDLEDLYEALEQRKGRKFERPLALLFHLLGFSTGYYGFWDSRTGKPCPDLLAYPKEGQWFLVIESTGRDFGNKLTKLATRARELQRAVSGYQAYPVLVTALRREVIPKPDLSEAAEELISIITADELSQLLEMATEGNPAKAKGFLERYIPPSSDGRSSYWPRTY